MILSTLCAHVAVAAGRLLGAAGPTPGPVPKVTPQMPGEVSDSVQSILNWTAGIGLSGAVLGGLLGWAAVSIGHNSQRPDLAARAKQAILWSLFAAGGIGLTSALVSAFYNMTS